jgi:hypothetical protein
MMPAVLSVRAISVSFRSPVVLDRVGGAVELQRERNLSNLPVGFFSSAPARSVTRSLARRSEKCDNGEPTSVGRAGDPEPV